MINMIKADFYRIFRGVGIYIAFLMMLFTMVMSIYDVGPTYIGLNQNNFDAEEGEDASEVVDDPTKDLSYEQISSMSQSEYRSLKLTRKGYALDREILSANINLYYVFIFLAAVAVTVDFSIGSVKNTLSSAINRKRYFASKILVIVLLALILFFLNTYLVYFINLGMNGRNLSSDLWTVTKISLMQIPPVLAMASILYGIAFLVRKSSAYNVIAILFVIVFQILLIWLRLPPKVFSYELQGMLLKLANNPSAVYVAESYAVCAVIVAVFTVAGYLSFKRAEIK